MKREQTDSPVVQDEKKDAGKSEFLSKMREIMIQVNDLTDKSPESAVIIIASDAVDGRRKATASIAGKRINTVGTLAAFINDEDFHLFIHAAIKLLKGEMSSGEQTI
jgi:hypothetical protein